MTKKINVLVFPAEGNNAVELHDALSTSVNVKVWGASSVERHGRYLFKNYIAGLPMITAPDFFERFNEVLKDKAIDVVFPTHDTVAMFFAEHVDEIHAKVTVSDRETAEACRDKAKTYSALGGLIFYQNYTIK